MKGDLSTGLEGLWNKHVTLQFMLVPFVDHMIHHLLFMESTEEILAARYSQYR